jgi:hypothetical protein
MAPNPVSLWFLSGETRIQQWPKNSRWFNESSLIQFNVIDHLKLTFVAEKPPPHWTAYPELLMPAEASTDYSS